MSIFVKLKKRWKKRKFCKANRYYCPDCIYHEHVFQGLIYRGIRCHYGEV